MFDGIVAGFFDQITSRWTAAMDWLFDPLWVWYFFGIIILLVVMVVAYFLPFKWVRATLGIFLLLVGSFIAGGRQMREHYKQRLDEEIRKRKAAEKKTRQPTGGGSSGGWPWQW